MNEIRNFILYNAKWNTENFEKYQVSNISLAVTEWPAPGGKQNIKVY